ncbi:MAG: YdcH family protein [Rhodospirillales bacterium]
MSMGERIESLKTKHQELEAALEELISHPYPDELEVANLKKQKLRIKDEMVSLSR